MDKNILLKLLLCGTLFGSCAYNRNIHFRDGKTQFIKQDLTSAGKETLVVFEPVIAFNTFAKTQQTTAALQKRYNAVLHGQLDHFLAERKIPHYFVTGSFIDAEELQNAVFWLTNVTHTAYRFDSLPLQKKFILPAGKPTLIILHQLGFRNEFMPNATEFNSNEPMNTNILFDKVVDITSHALLIKDNDIIYYRNNKVELDKLKWLRKHHKTGRIYKRILNDLFPPGQP
jgi:hypothetical protein